MLWVLLWIALHWCCYPLLQNCQNFLVLKLTSNDFVCSSMFAKSTCIIWWHKLMGSVSGWSGCKWVLDTCPGYAINFLSLFTIHDWSDLELRTDLAESNPQNPTTVFSVLFFSQVPHTACTLWQRGKGDAFWTALLSPDLYTCWQNFGLMSHIRQRW